MPSSPSPESLLRRILWPIVSKSAEMFRTINRATQFPVPVCYQGGRSSCRTTPGTGRRLKWIQIISLPQNSLELHSHFEQRQKICTAWGATCYGLCRRGGCSSEGGGKPELKLPDGNITKQSIVIYSPLGPRAMLQAPANQLKLGPKLAAPPNGVFALRGGEPN